MSLGFDAKNGARPMKRAIETHLQVPLGKWLKENSSKVLNKQFSLAINGLKDKLDIEIKYPDTPRMQPA